MATEFATLGPRDVERFRLLCAKHGPGPHYVDTWEEFAGLTDADILVYGYTERVCRDNMREANELVAEHARRNQRHFI
jgi:hypothetical protein